MLVALNNTYIVLLRDDNVSMEKILCHTVYWPACETGETGLSILVELCYLQSHDRDACVRIPRCNCCRYTDGWKMKCISFNHFVCLVPPSFLHQWEFAFCLYWLSSKNAMISGFLARVYVSLINQSIVDICNSSSQTYCWHGDDPMSSLRFPKNKKKYYDWLSARSIE